MLQNKFICIRTKREYEQSENTNKCSERSERCSAHEQSEASPFGRAKDASAARSVASTNSVIVDYLRERLRILRIANEDAEWSLHTAQHCILSAGEFIRGSVAGLQSAQKKCAQAKELYEAAVARMPASGAPDTISSVELTKLQNEYIAWEKTVNDVENIMGCQTDISAAKIAALTVAHQITARELQEAEHAFAEGLKVESN